MDVEKNTEEVRDELSVMQLMQVFPNNLAAEQWFEGLRWPDKADMKCPSCSPASIIESPVGNLRRSVVVLVVSGSRYGKAR